jgi:hypothetical protein
VIDLDLRKLANLLAETICETEGEIPEGVLYAGLMGVCSLDEFRMALGVITDVGLVERNPNFTVKRTEKGITALARAKEKGGGD